MVEFDAWKLTEIYLRGNAGDRIWISTSSGSLIVTGGQGSPMGDEWLPVLRCPGIGNLDLSWFAADYAHRNEDRLYVRDEDGSLVGDGSDEALIEYTLENGDLTELMDELEDQVNLALRDHDREALD